MNEEYVRKPITMSRLITLKQDELDLYTLYREEEGPVEESTKLYLDDYVQIDDETDEEVYPAFASANGLGFYFTGQVAADILANTRHQLAAPALADYIANFNYYARNDCFLTFG